MSDDLHPVAFPVKAFTSIETIDGGNTLVVRFTAPDDLEVALLVPQQAIADLRVLLLDQS